MKTVTSVPDFVLIFIPTFWLSLVGWTEIASASVVPIPETAHSESQRISQLTADETIDQSELLFEIIDQTNVNQSGIRKQKVEKQTTDTVDDATENEASDVIDAPENADQSNDDFDPNNSENSDPNEQSEEENSGEQEADNEPTENESEGEVIEEDSADQEAEEGESDSTVPTTEPERIPSIDDSAPIPIDNTPVQPEGPDVEEQLRTADPELGILILQEREPSISNPQQEIPVFLSGKLSFFDTDNAFSGLDPVKDQFLQFGASISATPTLGPRTLLIAEAEGTFVRYDDLTELDYNELSLQASLWQVFASGLYGEVGWQNRQLFSSDDGDRFLDEHSLQTRLFYREQLADDLRLDTYYQLRVSFTTPKDRSRILNRLVSSLTYQLTPDVEMGLIYLLSYTDYTQTERQDLTNQISAQISYEFSPRNRISLFSGYLFGDSTDPNIGFDNFIFGATLNVGVRLF